MVWGKTSPAPDLALKLLDRSHRALLWITRGRVGWVLGGIQVVELHTVGVKTGLPRRVVLAAPVCDDDRVVLVASKSGADHHPNWYRNLAANPDVEVTMGSTTRKLRARTASPEEKAALWPAIVATYKGYDGYQKMTKRDIPVVICEPRQP